MIIIVESPNKVKKIAALTGARVYATAGHFADLPSNEMGIDMQSYDPHFIVNQEKMTRVDQIINACDGETVYIASDADREGYAIGRMLHDRIVEKADKCIRLEIREITEKGIATAMSKAVPWDQTNHKFYDSFLGRRVADRLSGYILSPLASSSLKGKFSVGRVQSPAVRIIVDREREIRNFRPSIYFTISAKLYGGDKTFTAQFDGYPGENKSFSTRTDAMNAIGDASIAKYAAVESVEKKIVSRGPKAPFTTSDMQAAASISLSMSPDKSMQIAQGLFEVGLITYHRTDSVRLSDEFLAEAAEFVRTQFGDKYVPEKPKTHSSKASQAEAHEAIRPTHLHTLDMIADLIRENQLTDDHANLYRLIFKRAVASIMSDSTADSTSYRFNIGGLTFKASGSVPKFDGWQRLYVEETEDTTEEIEQSLPKLEQGIEIEKLSIDIDEKTTKVPGRYTEASLVKQLEKLGIGRPSTYAAIIGRIKSAGYVAIEKKKLMATVQGEALIDYLSAEHPWIIDYSMTAQMEETLDEVAEGRADWREFIRSIHEKMGFLIPEQRAPLEIKPPSDKQVEFANSIAKKKGIKIPVAALTDWREMSKFLDKHIHKTEEIGNCKCGGVIKEWDKSYQCSSCKMTVWKEFLGKKLTKTQASNLLAGEKITLIGLKGKDEKEFDAYAVLKDGKIELIFDKWLTIQRKKRINK